jgi:hypothetical protein
VVSLAADGNASLLVIPTDLRVRASGGSLDSIEALHASGSMAALADAMASFLGVEILFHVETDFATLVRAVDAFGRLEIHAQEPFDCPESGDAWSEGRQLLTGDEVVAYLRCAARDSRERGLRAQGEVLSAALRAGMESPSAPREAARSLHPLVRSNLTLGDLFNVAEMVAAMSAERFDAGLLPTRVVRVDDEQVVEPNIVATSRLVARLLRGTEFLVPEDVRIAVFNGNGARDLAQRTGEFLRARSFPVVHTGNAERFDYARTHVVHYGDADKADLVAKALPGAVTVLPADRFEEHLEALADYIPSGTDVIVVVGADFEVDDG